MGYSPDLVDDLRVVQDLAVNKSLNNIVLSHLETNSGSDNEFILILRLKSNNNYECLIEYTKSKASFLLAANMFRLPPAYKHNLGKYRMSMLDSFESQGSECLLEGVLYDPNSSHSRY